MSSTIAQPEAIGAAVAMENMKGRREEY